MAMTEACHATVAATCRFVKPNVFNNARSLLRRRTDATRVKPEGDKGSDSESRNENNDLADELARQGFRVSPELVRRLLHEMGYSLQAPSKQKEGTDHP